LAGNQWPAVSYQQDAGKLTYETRMNYEVIDFVKIIITQDHD
jgi:hypothetical protein